MRNNRDNDGAPIVRAGQGRDHSDCIETAVIGALLLIAAVFMIAGAL